MSAENEKIVKEINQAFERNDMEAFLSHCADDLDWAMAGEARNKGKTVIREWMKDMPACDPPKIGVDRMISTNDTVVCYGDMKMRGESGKEEGYAYCDIYTFADGKVTELRSFVVKHMAGDSTNSASEV